jgi:hypothetical protein
VPSPQFQVPSLSPMPRPLSAWTQKLSAWTLKTW